jgi:hypothetical protein
VTSNLSKPGRLQKAVHVLTIFCIIKTRDVPNFGITEISAETEAEIRFRHLGMSISAGRNSAEIRYISYLKVAAIFRLLFTFKHKIY